MFLFLLFRCNNNLIFHNSLLIFLFHFRNCFLNFFHNLIQCLIFFYFLYLVFLIRLMLNNIWHNKINSLFPQIYLFFFQYSKLSFHVRLFLHHNFVELMMTHILLIFVYLKIDVYEYHPTLQYHNL